jgi:hypothetical protein
MTKEFADVAQLVEQLIRNQQVNGSSPFVGSIISITFGSADCQLLYNCCTNDLFLQDTHCLLRPSGRSFDVKALGRTHVPVPQDALDRSIFDAELLEVGRESRRSIRALKLTLEELRYGRWIFSCWKVTDALQNHAPIPACEELRLFFRTRRKITFVHATLGKDC